MLAICSRQKKMFFFSMSLLSTKIKTHTHLQKFSQFTSICFLLLFRFAFFLYFSLLLLLFWWLFPFVSVCFSRFLQRNTKTLCFAVVFLYLCVMYLNYSIQLYARVPMCVCRYVGKVIFSCFNSFPTGWFDLNCLIVRRRDLFFFYLYLSPLCCKLMLFQGQK